MKPKRKKSTRRAPAKPKKTGRGPRGIVRAARAPEKRPEKTAVSDVGSELSQRQTLESAYQLWEQLRVEHRQARETFDQQEQELTRQGDFIVGAVRAARETQQSLATDGVVRNQHSLDQFHERAHERLVQAKQELQRLNESAESQWQKTFERLRGELVERIRRHLNFVKPQLRLRLRPLGGDRRILHLDRPTPDEAVLLCYLLSGKIPSRYSFLFDDSTDSVGAAPQSLYADEGVPLDQTRPSRHQLENLMLSDTQVLPLKGILMMSGPPVVRWVERGPVMEAEVADGDGFRNVLTAHEAETIGGLLLKMKLQQQIELELLP